MKMVFGANKNLLLYADAVAMNGLTSVYIHSISIPTLEPTTCNKIIYSGLC